MRWLARVVFFRPLLCVEDAISSLFSPWIIVTIRRGTWRMKRFQTVFWPQNQSLLPNWADQASASKLPTRFFCTLWFLWYLFGNLFGINWGFEENYTHQSFYPIFSWASPTTSRYSVLLAPAYCEWFWSEFTYSMPTLIPFQLIPSRFLSDVGLTGPIPEMIGQLTDLQRL